MTATDIIWSIVVLITFVLAFQLGRSWEILWQEWRKQ